MGIHIVFAFGSLSLQITRNVNKKTLFFLSFPSDTQSRFATPLCQSHKTVFPSLRQGIFPTLPNYPNAKNYPPGSNPVETSFACVASSKMHADLCVLRCKGKLPSLQCSQMCDRAAKKGVNVVILHLTTLSVRKVRILTKILGKYVLQESLQVQNSGHHVAHR